MWYRVPELFGVSWRTDSESWLFAFLHVGRAPGGSGFRHSLFCSRKSYKKSSDNGSILHAVYSALQTLLREQVKASARDRRGNPFAA